MKKEQFLITKMELEIEFLSTGIFHYNQIGLWTKRQVNDKFYGPYSSLFEVVSPIFYIIRVLGLAPYRFCENRLVSSNAHLFFSFSAIFINTYVTIMTFLRFLNDDDKKIVLTTTERGKESVVSNYFTMMFDLTMTIMTRNQFVIIWNIIQDFDYKTNNLGFFQNEKKTKFYSWIILIGSFLIWLYINQTGMYAFMENFVQNFSYMYGYIGTGFSVFKFSGIVAILGQRFKHLNKITNDSSSSESTCASSSKVDQKVLEKLRSDLMKASEKLNSLYYWSLLLWLFNLSFHIISGIYFFIQWLKRDDGIVDLIIYCCLGGWIISFIIQLILLHYACHFTCSEANRMGYILLNWRRWQSYHDPKRDFESTIHLMNYKLNFSAGGCCYVNLPLLRKIAGLLTTYLIILLQLPN
ncbi:gustatory receptor for sugar taste 43a-like [Leptopilina boulardi]|uniref:gustatory receptor for sugar taste 43a-like n=1 Tax=Leptopilina boulardi TaxID=63433 RepID=UPI0021F66F78|nr:gustatory receptor for sugar taste 43a-like [Leptopilina boulardi]